MGDQAISWNIPIRDKLAMSIVLIHSQLLNTTKELSGISCNGSWTDPGRDTYFHPRNRSRGSRSYVFYCDLVKKDAHNGRKCLQLPRCISFIHRFFSVRYSSSCDLDRRSWGQRGVRSSWQRPTRMSDVSPLMANALDLNRCMRYTLFPSQGRSMSEEF